MIKRIACLAMLAFMPAASLAGPFGYSMGQDVTGEPDAEFYRLPGGIPFMEITDKPEWDRVLVHFTPQTGVCMIHALRHGISNGFLAELAIEDIAGILSKKYGPFIIKPENDDDPHFYMTDTLDGELEFISLSGLPNNGISLAYYFDNHNACKAVAAENAYSDL